MKNLTIKQYYKLVSELKAPTDLSFYAQKEWLSNEVDKLRKQLTTIDLITILNTK